MHRFHIIEGASAILYAGGVYKQVNLFERADGLYAAYQGGFVRLYDKNGTSKPKLRWETIELPDNLSYTSSQFGKLNLLP